MFFIKYFFAYNHFNNLKRITVIMTVDTVLMSFLFKKKYTFKYRALYANIELVFIMYHYIIYFMFNRECKRQELNCGLI